MHLCNINILRSRREAGTKFRLKDEPKVYPGVPPKGGICICRICEVYCTMTFEEEQDLRILSLIKEGRYTYSEFSDLTKNEDIHYMGELQTVKKFIERQETFTKHQITDGTWKYWLSTLGRNRLNSLQKLKEKEDKIEKRDRLNFRYTLIAAISALVGIAVSIVIYLLQRQHE